MTTRGAGTNDLPLSDPGDTQVVDLRELDLRDIEGMRPPSRRTAPPPLPAPSVAVQLPSSSAPPVSPEPARASSSRPQRSNGFFVGVILAALVLSLVAGFFIASRSGHGASAPSVTPTARVITIAPVEVK